MASTKAASSIATISGGGGRFGRLWGRGHERLLDRRILSVTGPGATTYLQNLVTSNLLEAPTAPTPEPDQTTVPGVPLNTNSRNTNSTSTNSTNSTNERDASDASSTDESDTRVVQFNPNVRSTCFLDPKGRVVTDSFLWKLNEHQYYVDVPSATAADALLAHLHRYTLRKSAVTVSDASDTVHSHVVYGTLNSDSPPPGYLAALDPRHPSLGVRLLQLPHTTDITTPTPSLSELMGPQFPECPGNYALVRRLAGIAEGTELTGRVALETNQELLHAVAFDKGCYLGQELTARVHHTGVLRKRIVPLVLHDTTTQVPHPWVVASSLQADRRQRTFFPNELVHLPSRLPRLSVCTAAQVVAITSGNSNIEPTHPAVDDAAAAEWAAAQTKTHAWMQRLHAACDTPGDSKLVDVATGDTIGHVVAPPVPGTNVILALMRLDALGLLYTTTNANTASTGWSKTNKIRLHGEEFRYLPYLPLWWPELSIQTGKAKRPEDEDWQLEAKLETSGNDANPSPGMSRMEVEQGPLH